MGKPHLMVTGASGLLGANLCLEATDQGYPVTAVYHTHPLSAPHLKTAQINLTNGPIERISQIKPDWIIHCAAWTDVDACEANPHKAHQVNVEASQALARAAKKHNAQMIYISTDSVFDGIKDEYVESDMPAPLNVYAQTKHLGEHKVREELDANVLILRANIFGWNMQNKQSLAEWVLNQCFTQKTINGFNDVIFAPLLVNTLSQWILWSVDARLNGLYHTGNQTPCSKYQFAQQLANVFHIANPDIQPTSIDQMTLKAPRPKNTALNMTAISRILDHPIPTLQDELHKFRQLSDTGFVDRLKMMAKG